MSSRGCIVTILGLLSPLWAQAPLLKLSQPQRTPRGGWEVTLTNDYSAAATAFVLDANPAGMELPGAHPFARHEADLIPGLNRSDAALAPGASRVVKLGLARWSEPSYANAAVIYADGTSAGNPALVQAFLAVRKQEVDDIRAVLPILASAAADPELAQHEAALIQTFVARANAGAAAASGGPLPGRDRICNSVVATLQQQQLHPDLETPQRALAVLQALFTQWGAQLQGSAQTP